ncbi:GNAT family N-acetyltransferase [Candidatus Odyssella thessalonicensis]|uniref:GNAT family N-acetyltransferase n=1 Tax=Candidatus Odyssella thessalonicensis TaxID=84647 RepID=UPI000312C6A1|nr:GNAT family N-acetyltransferase [Candidatus Odyssella thessalonicensis]
MSNNFAYADRYNFKIVEAEDPEEFDSYLGTKITNEAVSKTGLKKVQSIALAVKNQKDETIGGLSGYEFYGAFIIDILWIEPDYRNQKIGSSLLAKAEEIAKQRNLNFLSVSTMEWWQCSDFYIKHGFKLEFIREGFHKNYKQYHLKKDLSNNK